MYKNISLSQGSENRITTEVKEQLQSLIDEVLNSIDVNSMDTNQKLKLLQLSLHYVLPKLRSTEIIEKNQSNLNNKNLKATERLERVYKILGN